MVIEETGETKLVFLLIIYFSVNGAVSLGIVLGIKRIALWRFSLGNCGVNRCEI